MNYDVPFRHQQALDPSALTTVTATLHAIGQAVEDCRNAGVSPESDPAVALLTRHMATVSATVERPPPSSSGSRATPSRPSVRHAATDRRF